MSSETIVTAIFLITAIVAAGVLASQVLPAVFSVSGTFSSSSHNMEVRIRSDITIVNTFANTSRYAQVWLRNTGDERIPTSDLDSAIIFVGAPGNFETVQKNDLSEDGWTYDIIGNGNNYLDPGEMLHVTAFSDKLPASPGDDVTFQIVLPNGVKRSEEFTVS